MKNGFIAAGEKLLFRAAHALEHHPKQVTALVAVLLLGAGGGAFAVARLDSRTPDVKVRQVLEQVQTLAIAPQMRDLERNSLNLFRTETTRANDTVESLLARLGVDDAQAAAFLRREPTFRVQLLARSDRNVTAEVSDNHYLRKLSARWTSDDSGTFKRLVIERGANGFGARVETAPLELATRLGSGTVRSTLFNAADEARIPDSVVTRLVELFSGDIDFHRQLRQGDRFNVVYETLEADGEPLRTGRILSAEFVNRGKVHQAMWFQEPGRKGGYYSLDGKSLDASYLASPMEFSRVSSGFKMRFHPVLHQWKAHLGVDFAADIGTSVRTVGEGTVEFAGEQNGFGHVVIVKHSATEQTVYAHLSRIDVRTGQAVAQGQNVGAVGQTGWATGPHLHFEFRVNGVHQNPSAMARLNGAMPLSAQARPEFLRVAGSMRMQLEAAAREKVQVAGN